MKHAVYMYMYVYVYIYRLYLRLNSHTHTHRYIYIHTYIHTYISYMLYVHIHVYIYTCIHLLLVFPYKYSIHNLQSPFQVFRTCTCAREQLSHAHLERPILTPSCFVGVFCRNFYRPPSCWGRFEFGLLGLSRFWVQGLVLQVVE